MSSKNSVIHSILKSPNRAHVSDIRKSNTNINKKTSSVSYRPKNKYHLTNSNSVKRGNIINSLETAINNDKINKLKSYLPYIPNKERQKAEDNFIDLIKAIVNSRNSQKNIVQNTISVKNNENERYRPRGYGYFEYIREHPVIIKDLDQNAYSKIIHDIDKKADNKIDYEKQGQTLKNKRKEITLDKKNNLTEVDLFSNNNLHYFQTQVNNHIEKPKNIGLNKSNLKIKINDNNKEKISLENNNRNFLPVISEKTLKQKDYHKSDIFYLVNDDLSKGKTSEQYLFKPNYSPRKLENDKKSNINEVGWSPKLDKNKSRIGCSSVAFNIINPSLKCLSPIKKEIDSLNNNNFEKPPLISDYFNMCKPGDTGLRKDFNEQFEENKNIFHRKNYCASYSDLHHEYKDLVNNIF
jgi:hypothetical protein